MTRDGKHWTSVPLLVVIVLAAVGAAEAKESMSAAAARERFVLAASPESVTTIAEAKELVEKTPDAPTPVVVTGRINAREHDPFLEGKASFLLIDIVKDDHAAKPGHDADNCPFCKKRQAKLPLAAVQFVDDSGAVVLVDSRKLFGLSKGQHVVVKGTATLNTTLPVPVLQITADGLYVVPKKP